jgi:hypothetical protein
LPVRLHRRIYKPQKAPDIPGLLLGIHDGIHDTAHSTARRGKNNTCNPFITDK